MALKVACNYILMLVAFGGFNGMHYTNIAVYNPPKGTIDQDYEYKNEYKFLCSFLFTTHTAILVLSYFMLRLQIHKYNKNSNVISVYFFCVLQYYLLVYCFYCQARFEPFV